MVKGYYEGVIGGSQNLLFGQRALDLFPLNHLLLREYYYKTLLDKNSGRWRSDTYLSWHEAFPSSSRAQGRLFQHRPYPVA